MTTIPSAVCNSARSLTMCPLGTDRFSVTVNDSRGTFTGPVEVSRAEFLAAVATELDVLVIPRADLPKVIAEPDAWRVGEQFRYRNAQADALRREALEVLALAEHLAANPPVDEAQVDALARVLADTSLDNRLAKADIRALVAAGVRAPEAGDQP